MQDTFDSLVLYRDDSKKTLLSKARLLAEKSEEKEKADLISGLLNFAEKTGIEGNLWHDYMAYYIAFHENPFSISCERRDISGSIDNFAMEDCRKLRKLFNIDIGETFKLSCGMTKSIEDFSAPAVEKSIAAKNVEKFAASLKNSSCDEDFFIAVKEFYKTYGAGAPAFSKAFEVCDKDGHLKAIEGFDQVTLSDLVGYESQKDRLIKNTEAFLEGRPANNVLLFGDGGTGKSTSIRAISNMYFDRGLRLIQVYRHQMESLNPLIDSIRDRNYRFIIYMDDLSFEDFETEYKYLKAVIEGGLKPKPENVIIYATSNRRHLIKETWKDRNDIEQNEDMHRSDSMEEKLSLAGRFGLQIYYGKPTVDEYHAIIDSLAAKEGIEMDNDRLHALANKWEIRHGGVSGRSARQFIDYIKGTEDYRK